MSTGRCRSLVKFARCKDDDDGFPRPARFGVNFVLSVLRLHGFERRGILRSTNTSKPASGLKTAIQLGREEKNKMKVFLPWPTHTSTGARISRGREMLEWVVALHVVVVSPIT